jgi:anti-sigma B factor antagonist
VGDLTINTTKQEKSVYLFKLAGSLDSDTYTQFDEEVKGIAGEGIKGLILDMEGLTYISSAGIGSVMGAKKFLKSKDASFAMTNLQPQIHEVFEVMKIGSAVNIFKNVEEADGYINHIIQQELNKRGRE